MADDADRASAAVQRLSLPAVQAANPLKAIRPGGTCAFQGAIYEVLAIVDGTTLHVAPIGR